MASTPTGAAIGTGAPGNSSTRTTDQREQLGQRLGDTTGRELTYVRASGAILAGSPVCISNGLGQTIASADAKGFAGIAEAAFATLEYGWVVSHGVVSGLAPSGTAVGDPMTGGSAALAAIGTSTLVVKSAVALAAAPASGTQLISVFVH